MPKSTEIPDILPDIRTWTPRSAGFRGYETSPPRSTYFLLYFAVLGGGNVTDPGPDPAYPRGRNTGI